MYQFNREEYEKRMEWFQEARFGLFIHWGIYSIPARGEWVRSPEQMPEDKKTAFVYLSYRNTPLSVLPSSGYMPSYHGLTEDPYTLPKSYSEYAIFPYAFPLFFPA